MTESRYERQLMLPEIGPGGQEKLSRAKVLVVGAGGLGSPISIYLTGAGIGTLGLMDDDKVSLDNLHRQILYSESQIGLSKALCAEERLKGLNSEVEVRAFPERLDESNAAARISDYDIVVDATDNAAVRYLISDTCEALGKPYVYGAICGLEGQVAVLCKGHATYRTLYPQVEGAPAPAIKRMVTGVTPAIVGSVEAAQVIQLVCGYGEALVDRLWTIDLRTMQTAIFDI
ncbi:MAG: HesA/MoeB/ThiF family protein [Candidatus Cryptobacteroides sp.]